MVSCWSFLGRWLCHISLQRKWTWAADLDWVKEYVLVGTYLSLQFGLGSCCFHLFQHQLQLCCNPILVCRLFSEGAHLGIIVTGNLSLGPLAFHPFPQPSSDLYLRDVNLINLAERRKLNSTRKSSNWLSYNGNKWSVTWWIPSLEEWRRWRSVHFLELK